MLGLYLATLSEWYFGEHGTVFERLANQMSLPRVISPREIEGTMSLFSASLRFTCRRQ
jgi:hypothetical protein